MRPIIKVENLSKRYRIGAQQSNLTLRESVAGAITAPFKRWPRGGRSAGETIWALRDVNLAVEPGEVVGVIGHNGAGKSTLFKILSRIVEPTTGSVELYGRVGSLLEVGTGFHPELTGRENVFLNGAILGMKRVEIERDFDEIVAFAEIEKFIDTPVKRYSSGMYMRLAFAVAAHLEPEILLIDEVLAVGDAGFQKKCLRKISEVAGGGRTVLFVSHNVRAIRQLCGRAVLIQSGIITNDGPADEVTEKYLRSGYEAETLTDVAETIKLLPPDPAFRLRSIVLRQDNLVVERVVNGRPLEIVIEYEVLEKTIGLRVFFDLCDREGTLLFRSFHDEDNDGIPTLPPGYYVSRAVVPAELLAPISYELRVHAGIYNNRMCTPNGGVCLPLAVEATGRTNRAYVSDAVQGKLALTIPWSTEERYDSN